MDSKPGWFVGYLKRRGTCADACQRHYRCSRWEFSQQGGLCFTKNKMCLTCRLICQLGVSVALRCFRLVSTFIDCERREALWCKILSNFTFYLLLCSINIQHYWIWIPMCYMNTWSYVFKKKKVTHARKNILHSDERQFEGIVINK